MYWINFLHLYQPANLDSYSIKQATDKSYYRLLRLLEENSELKMTWNISGCLLLRLEQEGEGDFMARTDRLVSSGRLELVSSAAYHPFLPLIPKEETVRQIRENERILRRFFGKKFRASGFFLPEMAYSPAVAKVIKELGYSWLILDELLFDGGKSRPDFRHYYLDQSSGLKIIFRNRPFSSSYPPNRILANWKRMETKSENGEELAVIRQKKRPIITATDAELYGLRHEDPVGELESSVRLPGLKTNTVSKFINELDKGGFKAQTIKLKSGSWETSAREINSGKYFKLWHNSKNKVHINLWKLAKMSLDLDSHNRQDRNYRYYRWHLVRGLASCTFWWASAHDFSKIFGPLAWNPDGIERGLEDLIRSVRSLEDKRTRKDKLKAEKYYIKIKKLIWEEHWKKHWKR